MVPAAKKAQPAVNNVFNFAGTPEKGKKDVDPKVKELTKSVMSLNFSEEASMASSATAIPENEEVEDSEEVEELKLDEHDIINGLKVMYKEKNGKDATDVEVDQWLIAIRGGGFEFNAEEQIETVN